MKKTRFGFALREPNRAFLSQSPDVDGIELTDGRAMEWLRSEPYGEPLRADHVHVSIHSLNLSVASPEPPATWYLEFLHRLADDNDAISHSDHLGWTQAGGRSLGHFPLMPLNEASLDVVCRNTERLLREFGRRGRAFYLENVAYWFVLRGSEIPEPEFIRRLLRNTGVGLLLDLTNVFANAANHKSYDPVAFIDEVLEEATAVQMHLAGGEFADDGLYYDSHSQPVPEPVWTLYRHAMKRAHGRTDLVIIERDQNYPEHEQEWVAEVRRARAIASEVAQNLTTAP